MIQQMLAIWSLVPLPFLNLAWAFGISWFTYCCSLSWRILSILACEISAIVQWFEHSLALPFFGIRMKADLFQSCGHCWVFHICWHIECSTFTASSFRSWNSSTEIPSPPLALFVVMFSKTQLTHMGFLAFLNLAKMERILWPSWGLVCPQVGFRKGRGTGDQIANIHWIIEKAREFQKNISSCFIDSAKSFDCVDKNKLWKILKEMGIPATWPASWEICMQIRKQQLEPDMEQQTGSK